jgi:uncharacterized protein (TIGR02186 family)
MSRTRVAALALAASLAHSTPASAQERIIVSLSTHRVLISSNFTGTDLVLFGAIENIDPNVLGRGGYDVVVTVRGPRRTFITRRKERILGIWVNAESREFIDVPAYLSVSTNRPPAEIGTPDFLRRNAIGLTNNMLTQRLGADIADVQAQDPFRAGFLRVKRAEGLFREEPNGVTYLGTSLFRAAVPIPGTAPTGTYEVETLLIAAGALLTRETSAIEVVKVGFEALVAQAARDHRLDYGLGTALLALLTGLFASLVFRRE